MDKHVLLIHRFEYKQPLRHVEEISTGDLTRMTLSVIDVSVDIHRIRLKSRRFHLSSTSLLRESDVLFSIDDDFSMLSYCILILRCYGKQHASSGHRLETLSWYSDVSFVKVHRLRWITIDFRQMKIFQEEMFYVPLT